ncbi:uncharacterized protein [Montipora foliosa]|uniref:uncharacterized protein n=1 Tax=Montipora foliosa TaxID=591990 RepID=UPI0035F13AF8
MFQRKSVLRPFEDQTSLVQVDNMSEESAGEGESSQEKLMKECGHWRIPLNHSGICQDFMVREDGALAQRLQEEEFGNHYLRNRSERKTVHEDVKAAKITYLEEVRSAQILPVAEVHNISQ